MTTTTTPTFTLEYRHLVAGDLIARQDLDIQSLDLLRNSISVSVTDDDWTSLRALYEFLDDARVTVWNYEPGQYSFEMILKVDGKLRGVFTTSQVSIADTATLGLIRSFTADNHLDDARLLDVLVGDAPMEA